jgi:hypothetical protein
MPAPARVLLAALFVLVLARAGLAFIPDMYGWGLNHQRFLAPLIAWGTWTIMALAMVPAVARRAVGPLAAAGDAFARGGWPVMLVCGIGSAALVYAFPDQVRFVGDFLLRQGTVEEQAGVGTLFPQALPLDVLLHYDLPLWMSRNGIADANLAARWIGSLEAGLLGMLAVGFVRALALRGVAAAAAFSVVLFGGYLGMFTGYSKAFVELVVLFAATGVFGLRALRADRASARDGTGALLAAGISVSLALTLHRTAPAMLPALALAWFLWWRGRAAAPLREPRVWLALAIPLVTFGVMAARIWSTILGTDAIHFQPAEVQAAGGPLAAALAGTRLVDLVNLFLLLSPLALAAPFIAATRGRSVWRPEFIFLLVLAAPCVLVWPFIHPVGGMHRDTDDFAFGAVAVSLVVAWLVAGALEGTAPPAQAPAPKRGRKPARASAGPRQAPPAHAWVGVAVFAGVALPALQWIALHANLDRGLARVEAFTRESPRRADAERSRTLDYIGVITFQQERFAASADAFRRAAELGPSPRILQQWALAETRKGDFRAAQGAYWQVVAKDSLNASAWLGLATVSSRFGDIHESRRAALRTLQLQPDQGTAAALMQYLDRLPAAMRDSLERLYPPRGQAGGTR